MRPPSRGNRLHTKRGRSKVPRKSSAGGHIAVTSGEAKPKSRRPRRAKSASQLQTDVRRQGGGPDPKPPTSNGPTPPTTRMVAFAERLAKDKKANLPSGYAKDFDICRRFLDQHTTR
jgi:DNA topoisomerase III